MDDDATSGRAGRSPGEAPPGRPASATGLAFTFFSTLGDDALATAALAAVTVAAAVLASLAAAAVAAVAAAASAPTAASVRAHTRPASCLDLSLGSVVRSTASSL